MPEYILDSLLDVLKLLPYLFLTYLVLEIIEHKAMDKAAALVQKAGRFGPVIGGLLGLLPQCGFSTVVSNLYADRLVTGGTLLAIFLATSDEMLPILISESVPAGVIFKILGVKLVSGLFVGLLFDLVRRAMKVREGDVNLHAVCETTHCGCEEEGGVLKGTLKHTFSIALFILVITLALNTAIHFIGEDVLRGLILNKPVVGPLIAGIVGLIPNCAASVIITELFLEGAMTTGAMLAGLLAGSGVGLLVLFRVNRPMKDNFVLLASLYAAAIVIGIVLDLVGFVITV
ncbi:MAG: arsenic efflux protein [Oscillospiraceae bacterium]|nr:arsenic efflux protein [Oscillospiraceae bacterium]